MERSKVKRLLDIQKNQMTSRKTTVYLKQIPETEYLCRDYNQNEIHVHSHQLNIQHDCVAADFSSIKLTVVSKNVRNHVEQIQCYNAPRPKLLWAYHVELYSLHLSFAIAH